MFDSIFKNGTSVEAILIMGAVALIVGIIYSFVLSWRLRSSKGYFITLSLMPLIVSLVIAIMGLALSGATTTTARIVTIAVALGLIRFRSINGKSEEILLLFATIAIGLICGLGYLAFATILAIIVVILYLLLSWLPIFNGKIFAEERLLKITIPESLNYDTAFNDIFKKFLKEYELVGIKTTDMGSMFKLSYRIIIKDIKEEKALIDELRVRNSNLEISILPYVEDNKHL